jgi:internalin A
LSGLTSLKSLDLQFNLRFTDAGLANLKGLTNLKLLNLTHTKLSDAGLVQLKGLTKLSTLVLTNTRVTSAGVEELQQALPSLTVLR